MSLGLLGRPSSGWRRVIGIAGQGVAWVAPCHWDCRAGRRLGRAVTLGVLGTASSGWRAPCHWDYWAGRRLGGAVSLGLLGRPSSGWRRVIGGAGHGWRRVIGIAGHGVVWVALCHCDCSAGPRRGGAVSLGLLGRRRLGGAVS